MKSRLVFPRSIRYLLAVAEHQSFTRAAEALHVSQPTLSQQIRLLEKVLDAQLLDRSGRVTRLTDAGYVYLEHARKALAELEAGTRAIHAVQDLTRGNLRIGMTPITEFLATPLLEHFVAQYPGIALSAEEMSQHEIESCVACDEIDIGIVFSGSLASESMSAALEQELLFVEAIGLAFGSRHELARQQRSLIDAAELERQPLVLLSSKFALRRHFDLYCLEYGIAPRVAIETNSLNMLVQSVRLDRLVTVLPMSMAQLWPGMQFLPLLPQMPHHSIALICRRGTYRSAASLAFGEMAMRWSAERRSATALPQAVSTEVAVD